MTEEKIQALENLTTQHSQEIQGIYMAMREIRDIMQACATTIVEQRTQINQNTENIAQLTVDIAELKQSTTELRLAAALQSENLRSVSESVERVNNTVERLATEAAQDRAEMRQIWEYLLRDRNNGHSD